MKDFPNIWKFWAALLTGGVHVVISPDRLIPAKMFNFWINLFQIFFDHKMLSKVTRKRWQNINIKLLLIWN